MVFEYTALHAGVLRAQNGSIWSEFGIFTIFLSILSLQLTLEIEPLAKWYTWKLFLTVLMVFDLYILVLGPKKGSIWAMIDYFHFT